MTTKFNLRGLALAAACVMIAVPAVALAQRSAYYRARDDYHARYGPGAYEHYYPDPYGQGRAACHEEKKSNEVGGALLGGIAGAVLGSNVARGGGREGGAIIGGVGGAALGADIAKNSTHC